jgi:FAD/FMN-containing dehydrogenase
MTPPPFLCRATAVRWVPVAALLASCGAPSATSPAPTDTARHERCRPGQACWPAASDWQQLAARLHGKLEAPQSPFEPCRHGAGTAACTAALADAKNPFALEDRVGATQSNGWLGAWTAAQSAYAVVAADASDVALGVRFARDHDLRLVIKGTGHDYLGRSNAPDSLLIWTHQMRQITVHDAFVATGCAAAAGQPAVSVGAGARWLEAYQEVTGKHGRYVQGGGCTSVGAAGGFLQGGGFGSWSKKYGIAAASLLEAEVVTAEGEQIIANACQHADLFWALRGGGGGTFGVVTKVTLMTHPLPSQFGSLSGAVTARTDAAFRELLARFLAFYRERLHNEHWGEQVTIKGDNSLRLSMTFQGLTADEARQVWQPFRTWVEQHPERFAIQLDALALPGPQMWSFAFFQQYAPQAIIADDRPGATSGHFWWAGDAEQISTYWYAYRSRWLPVDHFTGARADQLAAALFEASRHWTVGLHFNKGQAGASADAIRRGRETAMNPKVFDAAALAIIAASGDGVPGLAGHEPDAAEAQRAKAGVDAAMQVVRAATPDAGSYVNETDYFEANWQHELWGDHYPRLLAIKRKYDPRGLFVCHHCVGSEGSRSP